MRKNIIVLAATVVALCACQKNEIELLDKPIVKNDGDKVTYTFTAVIADDVTDIETKATMARTGAYTWAVDDELKFYKENGTSAPAKVTAVDGSTATITVTTSDDRAKFVSAVYPADAGDGAYKIKFNARGPIVVSAVDGGTLKFYHIGSVINLKFTGIPAKTQSLVFAPTSAFTYDGTFSFSDRKPVLTSTGSTSKIVVYASTADEGKDISISVPSVELSGFSAALNNASDGAGRNLFKKTTAESHNLADNCPVLMNMKKVACEPAGKFYVTTVSSSKYWDKQNVRLIQSEASKFETWMNCDGNTDIYIFDEYNIGNHESGYLNKSHVDDENLYQIYYNTSTGDAGPVYKSSRSDKPFYNSDFPINDFCIMGTFNEWGTSHIFTYNGNLNWVFEGLTISTDNTYNFGVRKASGEGFWAGANTLSGLYGVLNGNGNASVTLSAGTYNVYLCPTTDWNYLIMFEKQ